MDVSRALSQKEYRREYVNRHEGMEADCRTDRQGATAFVA